MKTPTYQSVEYNPALEIDNAELEILRICKTATQNLYSKERFKHEVDAVIDRVCLKLKNDILKEKTRTALRLYAQKSYAKQRQIIQAHAAFYAILIIGSSLNRKEAPKYKNQFDKEISKEFRHSPAFLSRLEKEIPHTSYPSALPLDMYHKEYLKKVENLTRELVESNAKEDYTTNVSLRNIAEMTIRYEHQVDMIEEKRREGKKLVYILAHANCSERCQKYQVGGTKHSSGLYSLDGTSGITKDGIKYLPLEFATDNPEDRYTTKAGKTYQNGCLTGFNCRHTLGDYIPGVKPLSIPDKVIEKRRALEQKQREYEREIKKYKKAVIANKGMLPKQTEIFKKSAIEKNEEYKNFCRKNKLTFYPERTKLFIDDNQNELTLSEKNAILYMNNRDVRKWYIKSISKIKEGLDTTLPLREQANIAYNKRNEIKRIARESMADFGTREFLDDTKAIISFDKLLNDKMSRKGLSENEAYIDIINTASKPNANVNKELRIK